jgi:hypothetical protein
VASKVSVTSKTHIVPLLLTTYITFLFYPIFSPLVIRREVERTIKLLT